jgi:host factor-I protein
MTDFNTGLPSVRFVQRLIKDQKTVEVKTLSSEVFNGKVLWQDSLCICLQEANNQQRLIWKQTLMYLIEKS